MQGSQPFQFIQKIDDPFVSQRVRTQILNAAKQFSGLWRPDIFVGQWDKVRTAHLNDNLLFVLEGFSRTARAHKPLRKLSDSERNELITQLSEISDNIGNEDLPEWAKQPLQDGLSRLRTILRSIMFFGYDAAIDQILLLHVRTSSLQTALIKSDPVKYPNGHSKIFKLLKVLAVAGELFCLPAESSHAFDIYRGWFLGSLVHGLEGVPEQKLLPPPSVDVSVADV